MNDPWDLVLEHLALVHHVVGSSTTRAADYDDAVADGVLGLYRAACRFDDSRGTKFSTYATYVVHREVIEGMRRRDRNARRAQVRGVAYDAPLHLDATFDAPDPEPSPEDQAVLGAIVAVLGAGRDALDRELIERIASGDYDTYAEIAERHGVSVSAVSHRLRRLANRYPQEDR